MLSPQLKSKSSPDAATGRVALVGAGPGPADLLTLRAMRLLQQADVVVYDNLVSLSVLEFVPADAERIYAGKRRNEHTLRQEEINALLVKLATEGKQVVRLKGGDPFIFGRGGEEMEMLAQHGIEFEVVPGVTAAAGVASHAGIPLTHRNFAQRCLFVTGHLKDGTANLDWPSMVAPDMTVVIYMGLNALPEIASQLIAHGASPAMTIAVVESGTSRDQRVVTGSLADISARVTAANLQSPSLIIIGKVVSLHETLAWFRPPVVAS